MLLRSDILVLLTDHQVFRDLGPRDPAHGMEVVDTRGIWRDRLQTTAQVDRGQQPLDSQSANPRAA